MSVVDASLMAKLFVSEPDSATVDRWFSSAQKPLVAPDLIAVEVAQAIVRRVNARTTARADGERSLALWRAMMAKGGIRLIRSDPDQIAAAGLLALTLGHPIKDCVYLALAMTQDAALVTCDAQFADRARSVYPAIELLAAA